MLSARIRKLAILGIIIAAPLVLLSPTMAQFHFPPGGGFSDLVITHFPNLLFIQRTIFQLHTIPLWNPYINSGYPFDADPLSGLWYPFGWLALVFSLPFGINLTLAIHIIWGGVGTYLFLRSYGVHDFASMLAGLTWALLPKIFGHFDAGHVTLIYAVSWTPWLFLGEELSHSRKKGLMRFMIPGLVLGFIILADVRWSLFAGAGWFIYLMIRRDESTDLFDLRTVGEPGKERMKQALRTVGKKLWTAARQCVLAFCVSAPLIIPLALFVPLSSRTGMVVDDNLTLSLPVQRILGLVLPDYTGNAEWIFYAGGGIILLAACSLFRTNRKRKDTAWGILFILSLVWGLGNAVPGVSMLAQLPLFNLTRVPARGLFMADFALVVSAALFLDDLMMHHDYASEHPRSKFWCNLVMAGLSLFTIFIGVVTSLMAKDWKLETVVGMAVMSIAFTLIFLRMNFRLNKTVFGGLLFLVFVADLGINDAHFIQPRSMENVLREQSSVGDYLTASGHTFRVYSPSYSLPQQVAMSYGIETVNGVHPLQIKNYTEFMRTASGIPEKGYSVTIPPFDVPDLAHANQKSIPEGRLLGLLNVQYVLSEFDIHSEELSLSARIGETRVYKNVLMMPRVWLEIDGQPQNDTQRAAITSFENPNVVEIRATGPGKLILSEIYYPGWVAEIDGKSVPISPAYGILRSIDVNSGIHSIKFIYRPTGTYIGIVISVLTLIIIIMGEVITRDVTEKTHDK